jgi:tRNA U38,U39,U40 pseudouridine synthase TruA
MVRMLTGTMVRFAHGRLPESELLTLIEGTSEVKTSACAPAAGLYLAEVRYGEPSAPSTPS